MARSVFVDTPGIHRPLHRLNVRMVDAAVETLREVDVVVLVFDASTRPGHGDEFVSGLLRDVEGAGRAGAEQDRSGGEAEAAAADGGGAGVAPVRGDRSGRRRRPETASIGSSRCCSTLLPEGEPDLPGRLPHRSARARARRGDRPREGAAAHARRAPVLDRRGRRPVRRDRARGSILRLYCTIYVETESQKPIVIGRGGEMIKRIGTEARHDLEAFFETQASSSTCASRSIPTGANNERALDDIGVPRTARRPSKRKR